MDNYSYNSYAESGDSSPRSREIDFENPSPWEDSSQSSQPPANFKVKFMCSYGGKIHPRPHDNQLSYVGGETKILAVDRSIKFAQLLSKLVSLCDSDAISFKYQLPGEDLDALISVTNDDDLEHMMHEYDRLYRISPKPARLRIFIFPSLSQNPSLSSSVRSFGSEEGKSEKERFVEALNSAPILTPSPQPVSPVAPLPQPPKIPAGNADFLFGMEKANAVAAVGQIPVIEDPVVVSALDESLIGTDPIQKHIQDLQRLRLEEQQQQNYRRRSEDSLSGGYEGEYYRGPEKITPVPVPVSNPVPFQPQIPVGAYPTGTDQQQVYMIPTQAGPYHTQMVRPMTGAPTQSYYIQRLPSDYYRDQQQQQQQQMQQQQQQMQQQQHQMQQQQQQMYNMMPQSAVPPTLQPQKASGYPEGYGMVRPVATGGVGMVGESAYAQMAYDGGMGRQVIYTTQGTVIGAPAAAQVQAAAPATAVTQYPGMVTAGLNQEGGGKVIAKATQPPL